MEWILNELSLDHQFGSIEEFIEKTSEFLRAKRSNSQLENFLLCTRELGQREVIEGMTFQEIVLKHTPSVLKSQILSWLSKRGPFWSDSRQHNSDDYFEFADIDVTDMGLGECARRTIKGIQVASYSFPGKFSITPIPVVHGLKEEPLGEISVDNFFSLDQLIHSAKNSVPLPTNWREALEQLGMLYPSLEMSREIHDQISTTPFGIGIFKSLRERFSVLYSFLESRDANGKSTPKTTEILNNYFVGSKAWFTDSSADEKVKFKHELTFADLHNGKKRLFPFHGKIKTPQIRIHFEWPIADDQTTIQIVYIGPKLTKR